MRNNGIINITDSYHLLCTQYLAGSELTHSIHYPIPPNLGGESMIPILQMRKLRLRED